MEKFEMEQLKHTLAMGVFAIKLLKQSPAKVVDGKTWLHIFDGPLPPSYYNDLFNANVGLLTDNLPEIATMLEIKTLEYQIHLANERLKELKK